MSETDIICSNLECRVAETGKCVEGIELEICPHYGKLAEVSEDDIDDEPDPPLGVKLPNGGALSAADASVLLRRSDTRLIAIIGPRETGKTSLIASLYDLLQEHPIDGIEFARSSTLHAFELTCHDARAASRRDAPHMERTRRGEVLFYHLDLGGGQAGDGVTLLLGDRSGEEYSDVADDVSSAAGLSEVRRADAITLLVDGGRLLDSGARHNLKSEVAMILQGLVDGGAIQPSQRVGIVLTKLDLVSSSPRRDRAEGDFSALLDHLASIFAGKIARIQAFKIAASPTTAALPRGAGVPALLSFWLEEPPPPPAPPIAQPIFGRAIARIRPLDQ